MPAFNAGEFVQDSVNSVLNQTYQNWELIVIDDGSVDNTKHVVCSFKDPRIRYFKQENEGVSSARNKGLSLMNGSYFCFLDADDLLTPNSLSSRLAVFQGSPSLAFVGGGQVQMDKELKRILKVQLPSYKGYPKRGLITLQEGCFINCGTWLVKRDKEVKYHFFDNWTHSEDLAFFLSIAEEGELTYTNEIVQIYRRYQGTAMSDLEGLAEGYKKFYQYAKTFANVRKIDLLYLNYKIRRIMFLSFIKNRKPDEAIKFLFNFSF